MNRLLYAVAGILAALIPATAVAASPVPSPSLDQVLAPAPNGFTELTTSPLTGHFTAHDYAQNSGANNPSEIETTLNHDGFVDGYGKTWVQQSASHALVELVIAFTGGKGAQDWLTSAEAGDKADPTYKHPDSISGIAHYYGVHFVSSSDSTVTDAYVFVKGNDVFAIGAASKRDDVLNLAMSQTSTQFSSAPNETIPSSDWPENKTSSGGGAGNVVFYVIAAIVVIAVIVLVAVLRTRRRAPAMAMGATTTYAPPMMSSPQAAASAPPGVQMSDDGRYWWDGQAWKDAEHEAPPSAQRSGDGSQWWDGRSWRPVPQQGPPPPATNWPSS